MRRLLILTVAILAIPTYALAQGGHDPQLYKGMASTGFMATNGRATVVPGVAGEKTYVRQVQLEASALQSSQGFLAGRVALACDSDPLVILDSFDFNAPDVENADSWTPPVWTFPEPIPCPKAGQDVFAYIEAPGIGGVHLVDGSVRVRVLYLQH